MFASGMRDACSCRCGVRGGAWLDDTRPYHVIHRIGSTPASHGVFRAIMDWCRERDSNLRIDTHRDNLPMQRALCAAGFSARGIIHLSDGDPRIAFERV